MCPVVKIGKLCVEATPNSKLAWISEELCIGCGICVKKCPFEAIMIINLPKNLETQVGTRMPLRSSAKCTDSASTAPPCTFSRGFCCVEPTRTRR